MVGLTGGIGAGKSAVSALLAGHGATIVDADLVAREVVEPGTPGLRAVVAAFGPAVVASDGGLNRAKLGQVVFGDSAALARLNAILHPLIGERTAELIADARTAGRTVLVHDVALLVEGRLQEGYDVVVVVDADPATQLRRLVDLRGMTAEDAVARIARQAQRAERLAVADEVISNEGTPDELARQVDRLWERLQGYCPRG
jgi:dephospho-CoA kinase